MRRLIPLVCAAFVLAAVTAMPAYAGRYTSFHNTRDSLDWHNSDGRTLDLKSAEGAGIEVTEVNPIELWGLRRGDVILAVDDHPVKHVDELFAQLQASKPADVKIQWRRGDARQESTIAASDYTNILSPHP